MTKIQEGAKLMLGNRARRMLRLLELDAPILILCKEAALIYKAACSLSPEDAGAALASAHRELHAREKQICTVCFDAPAATETMELCLKCLAECKKCDDEFDFDEEELGE